MPLSRPCWLKIGNLAEFITSIVDLAALPKDAKPQVAMVGRSNVGKSSLINHLAGRLDLARVSSSAGRTRTINLYQLTSKYYLVDLPGYGFAQASKDKRAAFGSLIADYIETTEQLTLVLLIIDAVVGPTALDHDMLNLLEATKVPFVMVVNKVDKLSQSELVKLQRRLDTDFAHIPNVLHSMHSGQDRDRVLGVINEALH
jgi:GTP-binding protein